LEKLVMNAKSAVLAGIGCVLMFLAGCKKPNVKQSIQTTESNTPASAPAAVEDLLGRVKWDGIAPKQESIPDFFAGQPVSSAFPESMVGVWAVVLNEDSGSKWSIKFEPDGSIKKIMHYVAGPVIIPDGGAAGNGPDPNTYFIFALGPCGSRYMPDTRTIKVKFIVDYYIMKLPGGELEGRLEDYLEGPVSEDGKTWNVKWWSFGWLKDAAMPDINAIKANPESLVFKKLEGQMLKITEDSNTAQSVLQYEGVTGQPQKPADSNAVRH
jgi:hypothetical protein